MFKKEPPLHQAVINNNSEEVVKLLQKGSDLTEPNSLGFTALEVAQFLGYNKIIAQLTPSKTSSHLSYITFPGVPEPIECSARDLKAILGVTYRSFLYFPNYQFFKETIHQCPWILKGMSLMDTATREIYTKFYPKIEKGEVADTAIQWINPEIRFGLFARVDFPENSYVGEYTGEVRPLYRLKPNYNAYCFHYPTRWWSLRYRMIDALKCGNELRFANHSETPNMEPYCVVNRGLLHLIFVTSREIKAGEELTFNYGADYWLRS